MPKCPDLRKAMPPSGSKSNAVNSGQAKPTKAWNSKNKVIAHDTGTPTRGKGKLGGEPMR